MPCVQEISALPYQIFPPCCSATVSLIDAEKSSRAHQNRRDSGLAAALGAANDLHEGHLFVLHQQLLASPGPHCQRRLIISAAHGNGESAVATTPPYGFSCRHHGFSARTSL